MECLNIRLVEFVFFCGFNIKDLLLRDFIWLEFEVVRYY